VKDPVASDRQSWRWYGPPTVRGIGRKLLFAPFPQPARAVSSQGALNTPCSGRTTGTQARTFLPAAGRGRPHAEPFSAGLAQPGGKAQDGLRDRLSRYRRIFIAIDPGKSGGIACRDTDGTVHAVPMPDTVADLDRLLRVLVCPETVCFIEDLPMYRGKMNLRSTAVLFRNFGRIEGVLASLKCRVEYLKPDWWQKALRLGKSADHGERWKAHLKERAQALFPRVEVTLKTADALLIL
jgi:hypothetical protein